MAVVVFVAVVAVVFLLGISLLSVLAQVDVQLEPPARVSLMPSLDDIQGCINKSAQAILGCFKQVSSRQDADVPPACNPRSTGGSPRNDYSCSLNGFALSNVMAMLCKPGPVVTSRFTYNAKRSGFLKSCTDRSTTGTRRIPRRGLASWRRPGRRL